MTGLERPFTTDRELHLLWHAAYAALQEFGRLRLAAGLEPLSSETTLIDRLNIAGSWIGQHEVTR